MINRINNILIGLLWLLASTLGATFWFNTMFGFNIFSVQHWQHLAYMQATGQSVKPTFYISIIVITFIVVFGLYKLLQPRYRKLTLPVPERKNQTISSVQQTQPTTQTITQNITIEGHQPITHAPELSPQKTAENKSTVTPAPTTNRPPRLNIPTVTRTAPIPRVPLKDAPEQKINPETEYAEIRDIFESAGYVFKGMPKIKGVQTATVAIGTNEVLWIGAVGVKNADMQRAVQTLAGVFSDTLDDIEIHINAFVVAAPDAADAPSDILQFANVNDLRNYITGIPNTPPDADETENFDAYSGYIGTVMDYIGKI